MSKEKAVSNTRPETAWDLMQEVHDAILASPTNYYQGDWAVPVKNLTQEAYSEACGTAYCRAGWMNAILTEKTPKTEKQCDTFSEATATKCYRLLDRAGIPYGTVANLFAPYAARGKAGTETYARSGAKGVETFMKTYERQLKAYRITDEDCK